MTRSPNAQKNGSNFVLHDHIADPTGGNNTGTSLNEIGEAESAAEQALAAAIKLLKRTNPDRFEQVLEREWNNKLFDLHETGLLDTSQIASHLYLAFKDIPSKMGLVEAFCLRVFPRRRTAEDAKRDLGFSDGAYMPGDEPEELIKRILPRDGVTMIGGQSGAGKTFVLIAMAMALATKTDFLGFPVRERCGVIIAAAEGSGTLPARLEAARRKAGIKWPLPIGIIQRVPDLKDPAALQTFVDDLRVIIADMNAKYRVPVRAVALDTVSAAFSIENENDNSEAAHICKTLGWIGAELGVAVIPIHHFGKNADQGLRGASAWRANVDHAISVIADRDSAGSVTARGISIMKSRIGIEGPACAFKLAVDTLGVNRYGEPIEECTVELTDMPPPASATKSKIPNAKTDRQFSKAFDDVVISKGQRRRIRDDGPIVNMVPIEEVKKEFFRRHITGNASTKRDASRKAWARALERALAGGAYAGDTCPKTGLEMIWDTMGELPFETV